MCPSALRFPGRGLRYVFEWRKGWIGLAGRQAGASRCRPRDRWTGWGPDLRFDRRHLIGNNTRFLILGAPGAFPNLASRGALAAMTRPLNHDRRDACGHEPLVAETFVDPSRFSGGTNSR